MRELLTARSCGRIKCLYHSAPVSAVPVVCRSDDCILRRADSLFLSLWCSLHRVVLLIGSYEILHTGNRKKRSSSGSQMRPMVIRLPCFSQHKQEVRAWTLPVSSNSLLLTLAHSTSHLCFPHARCISNIQDVSEIK